MASNSYISRRSRSVILVTAFCLGAGAASYSVFHPPLAYGEVVRSAYSENEMRSQEKPDEAQVRNLREEEIKELRITLGRRQAVNRRADLYLRLAEIYLEAYRAEFMLEGRTHEKRLEQGMKDTYIDRVHSKAFLLLGIKACREILSFNIQYDKMDQVYYFLAFNYGELGDHKSSMQYFEMLTRDYQNSPMIAEAYRQLGESAYDSRDYQKAENYLELAAKRSPPDTLPTILHKLAWSYFRTRQYDRAVDTMKQAIAAASGQNDRFLNLREESLRDMAVFMTEGGKVDEAIAYFQKVAGDKSFYPNLLEKLGRQYERNVEPLKAVQVYESLLKTHPDSDVSFRVRVKLVDLDLRQGHYQDALSRIKTIPEIQSSDTETQVAAQNLRAMVRRTATENHELYRKNSNKANLETAEAYYSTYLDQFLSKSDPHNETAEIRMYLAEVKRDLGKSQEASQLYREVVDSKDPRYAKEAAALWTASLADAIHKSSNNASNSGGAVRTEPSAMEKEFVDAADRLQDSIPDTNEAREASLKASQVEAGYKSTQKSAIKRIRALIKNSPKSPQALTASRLLLQLSTDKFSQNPENADDLRSTIEELRSNPDLMTNDKDNGGKLAAQLSDTEIHLKVNAIAEDEKDKDYVSAAKGYEAFAAESNQKELAEKAYANATADYVRSNDPVSVERVTSAWLKRYPQSSKAINAIQSAATQFLILGNFEASASAFEKVGMGGENPAALDTAARIYDGIGDKPKANAIWGVYFTKYPKSEERGRVALALARSYDAQRDDAHAAKYYKICMDEPTLEAECGARLGDLYVKGEEMEHAVGMYKKIAALAPRKKSDGVSPFVGYARFKLAERLEKSSHFEPLQLPEARLKKALNQRTGFLEPLSKAYMSAVEAGGPWAVAALDNLAKWATHFADEVDQITPPQGASAAAIEKFKAQLKGLSEPLRRKALATFSQGYTKATAAEVLSPAVPAIADQLADAHFGAVRRAQGYRGKFRLSGIPVDGGSDGREVALKKVRDRLIKNSQEVSPWIDYGNLLWGSGKPELAAIAYEYSVSLAKGNPAALNNRGVISLSIDGEEDWFRAWQSNQFFREALKRDEFFLPAKVNLAALFNYYRLFAQARPYWEQVRAKVPNSPDVEDGYAISLQGTGEFSDAAASFKKATELGANEQRFANVYHEVARQLSDHEQGAQADLAASKCLDRLKEMNGANGFEALAVENLKRTCSEWHNK
jgi:TolA-binding protein